ncbi:helix-turn-helix transcriptional regulator [Pseudomonas promysalinigenes]|uniref:Helix-turn-helix transcriptional regulator n=1 Tax=Pseudomonas promysalinigenes TaxID=485898 RepID=A0ABY6AJT8_9PSED|nr:helix-turn-helix transcriptional regulator [Pseudomonas promysalinigenes]UXH39964.1 helix-turn-helix transcriptional regulator [Pseudomonas promysalinigenes]
MEIEEARALASVIQALGTDRFGTAIDALLCEKVAFDMSCAYLFQFNQSAILVHNGYGLSVSEKTLNAYLRGGYLLDPFYVACVNSHPAGLWRMTDLAPDSFLTSGFSISKDIHPCVSSEHGTAIEEVGFIIPIRPQVAIVYSVMKYLRNGKFTQEEMQELTVMGPIMTALFDKHCQLSFSSHLKEEQPADVMLEDAFVEILQGQLTGTQRYIAKLLLQGHSNASIAKLLNISDGTVKVHKHNIYQRLGISTNAELFRLFIDYLAKVS